MSSPIPRLHESARADPQISLLGLRREDVVRVRRGLEAPLSLHQLRKGYQKYSHGRSLICALIPNVPSLDWRPPKADRQLSSELKRVPGRSEERRVGKECVSPCRSRWWQYH